MENIEMNNLTKKSQFNYSLPEELIAQTPIEPRDASRLMVLDKNTGEISDKHFYDIVDYLNPGDCLILNDSKVLPARIFGTNPDTGAIIEFLLLKQVGKNLWETLVKPGKKAQVVRKFIFQNEDTILQAQIIEITPDGNRIIQFENTSDFFDKLEKIGQMPLPPYIKEKLEDQSRYQTIYAKDLGSAAAPTAGLHFTKNLLNKIRQKGVQIGFVTLHVGLGTFRPVKAENINEHKMHFESYTIPEITAKIINNTKSNGKRVIAAGTTTCRTLEAAMQKYGCIKATDDSTDIFIHPGYDFKIIDSLITNFHLPESTLIMLVCALTGYKNTLNAYNYAAKERYRFFSFGDAMIII